MTLGPMEIKRYGHLATISEYVAYNGMVFISGQVATDPVPDSIFDQAINVLETIDRHLVNAGSTRRRILVLSITLTDMGNYGEVERALAGWLLRDCAPARVTTVESRLGARRFRSHGFGRPRIKNHCFHSL